MTMLAFLAAVAVLVLVFGEAIRRALPAPGGGIGIAPAITFAFLVY